MVKKSISLIVAGVVFSMTGCTSSSDTKIANLEKKLAEQEKVIIQKDKQITNREQKIIARDEKIEKLKKKWEKKIDSTSSLHGTYDKKSLVGKIEEDPTLGHLPKAAPGQAFTRVFVPAKYKWQTRKIPKNEKSWKYKIIPATYKMVEQKRKVAEETFKLIEIPATYKWEKDKIMAEPEKIRLIDIPAQYKMVTKKVLIKEARDIWKQGTKPVEKVDNSTGEIVCRVHIPAVYKTITEKVVSIPAHTKKVVIPPRYKYIKRKVIDVAAHTKKVIIPAKYEMVKVKRLVTPAKKIKINIEPEYQVIREKILMQPAHLAWKQILYKGLTHPKTIKDLQKTLKERGYNPGKIDGVFGIETKIAVEKYQKDKKLPTGSLAMEILRKEKNLHDYEKQQAENRLKLGLTTEPKEIK